MAKVYPPDITVTKCNDCPGKTAKRRVGGIWHYMCNILQKYRPIDPETIPSDCPLSNAE